MQANPQKYRWLQRNLPPTESRRLAILTGARQAGKTTLARRTYPDLKYVNLDAMENRDAVRNVSTFHWAETIGNAILDEAQKEPSVFDKVKYAYDEQEITFCMLLGSSQILMLKHIRESLAGRAFTYELWPLMMSELLISADADHPTEPLIASVLNSKKLDSCLADTPNRLIGEKETRTSTAEDHLLKWGGMPELLSLEKSERSRWLKSYQYTYLEHDLSDLAKLPDVGPFKKFEQLCALRSGCLLTYADLSRDAGISIDTARRYLEYLRLSYQALLLPVFSTNLTSRVIKSPKLYWADVGLMRQLSGFWGEITGEIYETMVVTEIYKWIKTTSHPSELFFYRTRSGMEVDLLIKTPHGIIGAEIKSREVVDKSDCRSLRKIAVELDDQWLGGLCIYRGKAIQRLGEPSLWAVPSFRLLAV